MTESTKPGYLFAFTTDLGGGQQIQVSGNLSVGANLSEFNTEFDKVRNALERQRARSAIDGVKDHISRGELTLARLKADIAALDAELRGKPLSSADKIKRDNAISSAKDLERQLEKERGDLAQLVKEAE